MKLQVRTTEDNKAQQFRFKPRAFKIDNMLEIDISALGSLASDECFLEWKEFHSRQEYSEKVSMHSWFLSFMHPVIGLCFAVSLSLCSSV